MENRERPNDSMQRTALPLMLSVGPRKAASQYPIQEEEDEEDW
jgi:hypothetical protein